MRRILSALFILTFLAGILSPACVKLWGGESTSYLEICTGSGLQKIALSDISQNKNSKHDEQVKDDSCLFCSSFSTALISTAPVFNLSGHAVLPVRVKEQESAFTKTVRSLPESRAPPLPFKA